MFCVPWAAAAAPLGLSGSQAAMPGPALFLWNIFTEEPDAGRCSECEL